MSSSYSSNIMRNAEPVASMQQSTRSRWWNARVTRYATAVLLVVVAHVIVRATIDFIGPAFTSVFLAAVLISSLYGGRGPGLVATLLAALDLEYSFSRPYNSFSFVFDDFLWLIVFLTIALLTSALQARRHHAEESLRAAHGDLEKLVKARTMELVRSQEQFALLVNGVPDQAVFILDSQARVASWNAGAHRLLGYPEEGILGRHISVLWPQFGRRGSPPSSSVALLAEQRYEDQGWVHRQDGTRFWAAALFTRVENSAEHPNGFAVSLRDITERRTLEQEIVEISEREQQRIGHDLHDGLGQELTGIAMLSTALAQRLESDGQAGADEADKVADLIHESIRHTRDLARGLCPVDLEDGGLMSALHLLADRVSRLPGVECTFITDVTTSVDVVTAAHLYRIAQEAINNAMRHGKARKIMIRLRDMGEAMTLSIIDDGLGIREQPADVGMGLRLMEYRAKAIRGSIQIRRTEAGGTAVECTVDQARGAL